MFKWEGHGNDMKIVIQDCPDGEEEEIIIRCRNMDEQMLRTIYALKAGREKITVQKEDKILQVLPEHVFYFESVDNRVFVYMEKEVYETRMKLYELEELLMNTSFFRASKSVIINLSNVSADEYVFYNYDMRAHRCGSFYQYSVSGAVGGTGDILADISHMFSVCGKYAGLPV